MKNEPIIRRSGFAYIYVAKNRNMAYVGHTTVPKERFWYLRQYGKPIGCGQSFTPTQFEILETLKNSDLKELRNAALISEMIWIHKLGKEGWKIVNGRPRNAIKAVLSVSLKRT